MTSSEEPKPAPKSMSRRFMWLAIAIVAGIALYTAGWFWAAGRLEGETARALAQLRAQGHEADCSHATARGYPFRIGLYCDGIAFSDFQEGISVSGSGLRTAAQIYQPLRIVGELDTLSADLVLPAGGVRGTARDVRFSTRLAWPLPELISVESKALVVCDANDSAIANAPSGALHLRPRGDDLDIAGNLKGLVVLTVAGLPPVDLDSDVTVTDGVTKIRTQAQSARGTALDIRNLAANAPDGGVIVSGKAAVDMAGLLDATLEIDIRNPPAVAKLLATALPDLAPDIERYAAMISALGDNPKIPLSIVKGNVKLGIFTIGTVPAIQ